MPSPIHQRDFTAWKQFFHPLFAREKHSRSICRIRQCRNDPYTLMGGKTVYIVEAPSLRAGYSSKDLCRFVYMVHNQAAPPYMGVPTRCSAAFKEEVLPFIGGLYPVDFVRYSKRVDCIGFVWNQILNCT